MTNEYFTILIALNLLSPTKKTTATKPDVFSSQPAIKCDSIPSINKEISIRIISPMWASTPTSLLVSSTAKVITLKKLILKQWRLINANLYYKGQMMDTHKKLTFYGVTKPGTAIEIYYSGMDVIID